MKMRDCLNKIKKNRNVILTGEIGALLHDIGKLHPGFIRKNSAEDIGNFLHANIDDFLAPDFVELIKNSKFEINIRNEGSNIYNLITQHHKRDIKDDIVKILIICDHKDSADDKGIVRKKQPLDDTWISSPFGYKKEKIDINCLQKRFDDLQDNLIGLFKNYTSECLSLTCFRESLLNNLKTAFSHALGETRVPANDVTLWDHSYSTASLFKSLLVAKVCGISVDPKKAKWRIFGICWNGQDFINRGKKIGEIQAREKIIRDIKGELKKKFEDEIPIGNAIYEDLNGIYFTFPDLDGQSKDVVKELAQESLKIIYDRSNDEIWPFFTLSKASSTLTIIADELKFVSGKRKIPKMTPTLLIEGEDKEKNKKEDDESWNQNKKEREKIIIKGNIDLDFILKSSIYKIKNNKDAQIDICPICRIRPKNTKDERCKVCDDRRKGRLGQWFSKREETIWTEEVADKNNRIALISLNFYLDKWLDGTMIGTIYSQSFEDWIYGEKKKNTIQLLREAEVNEKLQPNKKTVYFLMEEILKNKKNKKKAAGILDTFFQDVNIRENLLDTHLNNIKERIGVDTLTKETLATYLFTQNPSPARLYRVCRETEEFFELILSEIRNNIYSNKWKRVKFTIDDTNTVSKLEELEDNTPYIIKIKGFFSLFP